MIPLPIRLPVLLALLLLGACAEKRLGIGSAPGTPHPPMAFERGTTRLSGWIAPKGEWMLFSSPDLVGYDPYAPEEERRCISMVNDTGRPRTDFHYLSERYVRVTGHAVAYDELGVGTDVHSQIMQQKTYEGEKVFNFCLRELIFVVKTMEPAQPPSAAPHGSVGGVQPQGGH